MPDVNELYVLTKKMLIAYGLDDVQIMIDYQPSMYVFTNRLLYINQDTNESVYYMSELYDVFCLADKYIDLNVLTVYKFVILHEIGHAFQHKFFEKDFIKGMNHARKHLYRLGKTKNERNEIYHLEPREQFANNFALDHINEWL